MFVLRASSERDSTGRASIDRYVTTFAIECDLISREVSHVADNVGRKIGDARDDRKTGTVGKCGQPRELNSLRVALEIKRLALRVEVSTGDDVTSHETNINTLDAYVSAVKRSARRRSFEGFTAELAWSKTKIGAAAHRVGNFLHTDRAGKI